MLGKLRVMAIMIRMGTETQIGTRFRAANGEIKNRN